MLLDVVRSRANLDINSSISIQEVNLEVLSEKLIGEHWRTYNPRIY
jgi:hypothetical protein